MSSSPWNPMNWVSDHWARILGITAVFTFLYKMYFIVRKVIQPIEDLREVKQDITTIRDNHLPHIQIELEKICGHMEGLNETMSGLRDDIRIVLTRMK